ncbi:hypothetical protein B0T20DRAFT_125595 [Sordaria brevicollis]|uniref:Uncharacterized protein n=1 Tax=Sordaria brevicollis TaxID=83679 RepID=A0AAE0PL78_SORBR|nr:hypothetical protein B0T20DRAFT_125595 [Sordaria brevicollis]
MCPWVLPSLSTVRDPTRKIGPALFTSFQQQHCTSTPTLFSSTALFVMNHELPLGDSILAHSCAFCQRFVIDRSEENGGLSATRRQMLDLFLFRAGFEGPDVSHPEEYKEDYSKLRTDLANPNFILFDIGPRDLKSVAARDCLLARDLDQAMNQIHNPLPPELQWQKSMLLGRLDVGSMSPEATAHLYILLYDPRVICPKRSRPGKPVLDYWTRPWIIKKYYIVAEEGVSKPSSYPPTH